MTQNLFERSAEFVSPISNSSRVYETVLKVNECDLLLHIVCFKYYNYIQYLVSLAITQSYFTTKMFWSKCLNEYNAKGKYLVVGIIN